MSKFHQQMRAGSKGSATKVERRNPQRIETGPDGNAISVRDPAGYWHGQHTNPVRAQRRRNIEIVGGIRQFKIVVKNHNRAVRDAFNSHLSAGA